MSQLKFDIWIDEKPMAMRLGDLKDLEKIFPAFMETEEDIIKSQKLVKKLINTLNELNKILQK